MSASKQRNLNVLLDSVQTVHRKDIRDYAGGHLNESRLYKQPTSWTYQGWDSAKKGDIVMKQKSKIPRAKKSMSNRTEMKETMLQFATGTAGAYLGSQPQHTRVPGEQESRSPDVYDEVKDNKLITELDIGGIILPAPRTYRAKGWNEQDLDPEEISKPVQTQGDMRSMNLASKTNRQYVPIPVGAVTKTDQYRVHKKLENDIVCKAEAQERGVLLGSKAVEHLEDKLKENLEALGDHAYGPNFNRLQVYIDVFQDLTEESPTFGHVLRTIQEEYNNYIDFLVESQPSQHNLLREQVDNLTFKGVSKPLELAQERKIVSNLEAKGKQLLETNEKLRKEIDVEQKMASEMDTKESKKKTAASYQEREITAFSLDERIEDMRANVLEKLDALNNLKDKLTKNYVPASVCVHLESCVKDTETDVQRLLKHNELINNEIETMERELQQCIQLVEGNEEDQQRIWRKIEGNPNEEGYFSPHPEEDESRWDFYIS